MNDALRLAQEDAENQKPIPEDKLDRIRMLGQEQKTLANEVKYFEEQLKAAKESLRKVSEFDLPEAMDDVGMTKFSLEDGSEVKVSSMYTASIPDEYKDEAYQWLKDTDNEGIIKADVKVVFGKGEFEIAQSFLQFIRGFNEKAINPEYKEHIHYQTLRAFVKEQIEGGHPLPLDKFGVYIGRKATLKTPK